MKSYWHAYLDNRVGFKVKLFDFTTYCYKLTAIFLLSCLLHSWMLIFFSILLLCDVLIVICNNTHWNTFPNFRVLLCQRQHKIMLWSSIFIDNAEIKHGSVAIASITSCTNASNQCYALCCSSGKAGLRIGSWGLFYHSVFMEVILAISCCLFFTFKFGLIWNTASSG